MNIEEGWAKLQETRRLEKIELRLRKEREIAASLKEEEEAINQLKENEAGESVVLVEHEQNEENATEEKKSEEESTKEEVKGEKPNEKDNDSLKEPKKEQELDSSVGSLATSFVAEEEVPLPAGILSKKEKNLLWDEIKTMSKHYTLFLVKENRHTRC